MLLQGAPVGSCKVFKVAVVIAETITELHHMPQGLSNNIGFQQDPSKEVLEI